ncbi:MAG: NAD(+) kinase [Acidobacteria bacterium]|nr:NAD(+) kinase [Acidobacteriota bacterium]
MTSPSIPRVGIVAKRGLTAAVEHLVQLVAWLTTRGVSPVCEVDTHALGAGRLSCATASREDLPRVVDLIVVLGGDGTLLGMADRIGQAGCDIPILGVNFGNLGFLTEIRISEVYDSLEAVLAGTATFDHRLMLAAEAERKGRVFDSRIVLNDVVFTKTALSRMIELSVSVSGRFVTSVRADGLIIATATGSTAYNLAAGGPIVHPLVDAFVLTPIAPHTLTNRPVVIPGSCVVEVQPQLNGAPEDSFVTYDGQSGYPLQEGDVIRVQRASATLRLVKPPARGYFELLREKLKWNER